MDDFLFILPWIGIAILFAGLAALFWIDLRDGLLPDRLVFPLAALGLLLALTSPIGRLDLVDCISGALIGFGAMALIRFMAHRVMGREAMGFGDVKFMGMAGLWVGWQGLNAILLFGALASLLIFLARRALVTAHQGSELRGAEVPLGPGLCLALGTLVLLNAFGLQIGPALVPM